MKIKIHCEHPGFGTSTRTELLERVRAILAPYANRLSEVRLSLTDQNGPRKGEDLLCVATARMGRGATVAVTANSEPNVYQVTTVLRRLRRSVRKRLERKRTSHRRPAKG
ncbi:MAG: hypothetical protein DWQ01_06250 [Planctomycetota bacterium]|nr:MAG: hypothetical protein DWQ01_06250 [Planctomycetota bacterium]